ncbi:hypothetical protein ACFLZX_01675 [Nanoarchaeota archaeon]
MNKKGFIASSVVDFYATVIFLVVIILIYSFFQYSGVKDIPIYGKADDLFTQAYLQTYLKTPMECGYGSKTVADCIELLHEAQGGADYDNVYDIWKEESSKLFKETLRGVHVTISTERISLSGPVKSDIFNEEIEGSDASPLVKEIGFQCAILTSDRGSFAVDILLISDTFYGHHSNDPRMVRTC